MTIIFWILVGFNTIVCLSVLVFAYIMLPKLKSHNVKTLHQIILTTIKVVSDLSKQVKTLTDIVNDGKDKGTK